MAFIGFNGPNHKNHMSFIYKIAVNSMEKDKSNVDQPHQEGETNPLPNQSLDYVTENIKNAWSSWGSYFKDLTDKSIATIEEKSKEATSAIQTSNIFQEAQTTLEKVKSAATSQGQTISSMVQQQGERLGSDISRLVQNFIQIEPIETSEVKHEVLYERDLSKDQISRLTKESIESPEVYLNDPQDCKFIGKIIQSLRESSASEQIQSFDDFKQKFQIDEEAESISNELKGSSILTNTMQDLVPIKLSLQEKSSSTTAAVCTSNIHEGKKENNDSKIKHDEGNIEWDDDDDKEVADSELIESFDKRSLEVNEDLSNIDEKHNQSDTEWK